jgi:hypothetical protein
VDSATSQDPVVVEPVVNAEKLRELLAWEAEYPTLDFKSACDLSLKQDLVELAKDVGAMSVRGGFLIIGVDKRGLPTGTMTDAQARLFDEAQVVQRDVDLSTGVWFDGLWMNARNAAPVRRG